MRNSRARRDYFVDETLEAGIALKGTEVKSIRQGMAQINEGFVRIDKGTPILYHAHIAEYAFGTNANGETSIPLGGTVGSGATVTYSVAFLGSLNAAHVNFVGMTGDDANFFYNQSANKVNYVTMTLP